MLQGRCSAMLQLGGRELLTRCPPPSALMMTKHDTAVGGQTGNAAAVSSSLSLNLHFGNAGSVEALAVWQLLQRIGRQGIGAAGPVSDAALATVV